MLKRTDAQGRNIDLRPRVLLVPADLEVTGRSLLVSDTVARYVSSSVDSRPEGNPWKNALDLAIEPRLSNTKYSGYSAKAWYLFSAPADGAVVVGFLDGKDSPTVEQVDMPADQLGIGFRGYIDFGVSLADPRAATKAKGEA